MAQTIQESLLEKLLKSRYPLTNYLSRQQQFVKIYSTTQSVAAPTLPPPSELATNVARKSKAPPPPPPPPSCFDVPDTLDPDALEYNEERNDIHSDHDDNIAKDNEMNPISEMNDDDTQRYDETLLLKSINNRMNDSNSENTNAKLSSILKRSSAIQLDFSSMQSENNSPLQKKQ